MGGRSWNGGLADARYKYTEKERDAETGYDYFGARYYDARVGRFLAVDPHMSTSPGLSSYLYSGNNPLAFVDPTGMDSTAAQARETALSNARAYSEFSKLNIPFFSTLWASFATGFYVMGKDYAAAAESEKEIQVQSNLSVGGVAFLAVSTSVIQSMSATGNRLAAADAASVTMSRVPLYRAVNEAELRDMVSSGGAFHNPPPFTVKYFSTEAEGASSYARQAYQSGGSIYQGPYTVVETQYPLSAIAYGDFTPPPDKGIPTVIVPTAKLSKLAPGMPLPYTPLPRRR